MAIRLEDLPLRAQQQAVAKLQKEQLRKQKRAAPKYHNEETEHLGIRFASRKEARRYEVLLARLHAGEIRNLRLQQDFTLQEAYTTPEGERVRAIRYKADFCYEERVHCSILHDDGPSTSEVRWEPVVEDVKSRATRTQKYIIKRKLMQERFNITIREV